MQIDLFKSILKSRTVALATLAVVMLTRTPLAQQARTIVVSNDGWVSSNVAPDGAFVNLIWPLSML